MMSQGSSEVSIMFVVHKDQEKAALKALYNAFFGESKEDVSMAQSLNKTVLLNTTGTSYLSIAGKVGKFLVGDQALEFYPECQMLNNLSRFLGAISTKLELMLLVAKSVATSKSLQIEEKFLFASKDSRCHSQNCS